MVGQCETVRDDIREKGLLRGEVYNRVLHRHTSNPHKSGSKIKG